MQLDVLAGMAYGGRLSGRITADGQPLRQWAQQGGKAAYVMQHDVLPAWDTPREALTTAALLRLPADMPRADKLRRVQELVDTLVSGTGGQGVLTAAAWAAGTVCR